MVENDRRIRKTKTSLKHALISLMDSKDIKGITIKELTDTADVQRATFYKHYMNVYDLYEQLEKSVIEQVSSMLDINPSRCYADVYGQLVDFVEENALLLKVLLGKHGNNSFQKKFCIIFEEKYIELWLYEDKLQTVTEEMRFLTTYHIQGGLAIVKKWLDNDLDYPKQKILVLLNEIDKKIEQINEFDFK